MNCLDCTQALKPLTDGEKNFFTGMGYEYFDDGGLVFISQDSGIYPTRN
ncbi:MAG: hypothetical protein QNJ18_04775 [Xenococcaceae cyanobacterium MO_167.B52]|nr:hypothetical protein [Xenococcaceae cyanobacterium MO_167.B52]